MRRERTGRKWPRMERTGRKWPTLPARQAASHFCVSLSDSPCLSSSLYPCHTQGTIFRGDGAGVKGLGEDGVVKGVGERGEAMRFGGRGVGEGVGGSEGRAGSIGSVAWGLRERGGQVDLPPWSWRDGEHRACKEEEGDFIDDQKRTEKLVTDLLIAGHGFLLQKEKEERGVTELVISEDGMLREREERDEHGELVDSEEEEEDDDDDDDDDDDEEEEEEEIVEMVEEEKPSLAALWSAAAALEEEDFEDVEEEDEEEEEEEWSDEPHVGDRARRKHGHLPHRVDHRSQCDQVSQHQKWEGQLPSLTSSSHGGHKLPALGKLSEEGRWACSFCHRSFFCRRGLSIHLARDQVCHLNTLTFAMQACFGLVRTSSLAVPCLMVVRRKRREI
jgi:hypothetical protein